ncbi:MAG: hypothetical protein H6563_13475 [Lewinellaceae bacterium]|nr:hypothetical protein [Lewinellaceae bacterium]
MEIDQLKKINRDLKEDIFTIKEDIVIEISKGLRFAPQIEPLFIIEVNIFVHELHRILEGTHYYDEIEEDMEFICKHAFHLADHLQKTNAQKSANKPIPVQLIANMKEVGKRLKQIAPHIRLIAGFLLSMNSLDFNF